MKTRVVYHLPKNCVNFGWNVQTVQPKSNQNIWNVTKASSMFPIEMSTSEPSSARRGLQALCQSLDPCHVLNAGTLGLCCNIIIVLLANTEWNFTLGMLALHLLKLLTNRFPHVNGKQPGYYSTCQSHGTLRAKCCRLFAFWGCQSSTSINEKRHSGLVFILENISEELNKTFN